MTQFFASFVLDGWQHLKFVGTVGCMFISLMPPVIINPVTKKYKNELCTFRVQKRAYTVQFRGNFFFFCERETRTVRLLKVHAPISLHITLGSLNLVDVGFVHTRIYYISTCTGGKFSIAKVKMYMCANRHGTS